MSEALKPAPADRERYPDFEWGGEILANYRGSGDSVTVPPFITHIGDMAFMHRAEIRRITLPSGLKRIGMAAFFGCTALEELILPDGVTSIEVLAFGDCTALSRVKLPDSLTFISSDAFNGTACEADKSNWENGAFYLGNHLIKTEKGLSGSFSVRQGTVSLSSGAFSELPSLTSVTLPDSVNLLCFSAFDRCDGLERVYYPPKRLNVNDYAFMECRGLTERWEAKGLCLCCGGETDKSSRLCSVCGRCVDEYRPLRYE